jgi:uncharacterized protein YndB with AHSA1/START domain
VKIAIETTVAAPLATVWEAWTTPADIVRWNAASDDWCCPHAENDLRVGGLFRYRMEARDGSFGFDFTGRYTRIVVGRTIEYALDDDRVVTVEFSSGPDGVTVRETFDAEDEHAAEMQRQGWLAILRRFASHVVGGRGGAAPRA